MPLKTQLIRKGKPVSMGGSWSFWHLARLYEAMLDENGGDEEKVNAYPRSYTFKEPHTFTVLEEDVWARGADVGVPYTLEIRPGDIYKTWHGYY